MENELPFRDGASVNQYRVQRHLEGGALGPVYQALDTGANRTVEMRVVEGALDDPVRAEAVRRAAQRLTRLRHPNLLSLLNFGEYEGTFYLIYDFVRGTSLAERIENDPPHPDFALRIIEAVGEAIDFIHDEGLVHGSLVPESIVLGQDGHPFVADVGIVPHLSDDPERYTADRDRQYVAAIAYHLLTGSEPGTGRNLIAPSRLNPRLGPATDAVLLRGLSTGPGAGYPNCDQFLQELRAALHQDQRTAARGAVAQPGSGRRGWIIAGVVALLGIIVIAAIAWFLTHQSSSPMVIVSSTSVNAGDSVVVTGKNLPPNQAGTIQVQSTARQIGVFQADKNGTFNQSVQIPKDLSGGGHVLSLCWNGSCPAQTAIQVTATPSPTPTPTPPPTPIPTPPPTPIPTPVPTPTPTRIPPPPTTTPTAQVSPAGQSGG